MSAYLRVGEHWRVISMIFDQGMSTFRITSIITCSIQIVYNILNLFLETDDVLERRSRGGQNLLTVSEHHTLRQLFYRYSNETSAGINNRFRRRTGCPTSLRSIRNYRRSRRFHLIHAKNTTTHKSRLYSTKIIFSITTY